MPTFRRPAFSPGSAFAAWFAVLLALVTSALAPARVEADGLRILAATNDIGALARAVGGDAIDVDVVARPDRDPHALEIRPSTMRRATKADLYLAAGLSLDLWSDDIVRGSRQTIRSEPHGQRITAGTNRGTARK